MGDDVMKLQIERPYVEAMVDEFPALMALKEHCVSAIVRGAGQPAGGAELDFW